MVIRLIISRPGAPVEERLFDDEIITIGSDTSATLHLKDSSVAPEQAIIIREDGRPLLINRAAGTLLNGEALARETRRTLAEGDVIEFGPYAVSVAHADDDTTSSARAVARSESRPRARLDERGAGATREDEGAAATSAQARQQGRSFAAILDSLRTEEDSFYFVVESAGGRRRVRIEAAETMVGWDESGRRISCDAAQVLAARAVVRKDWSGVVALPLSVGMILVNGETVEGPRRLRDGDRVTLLPTGASEPEDACLVFHEPASLVVLDTLLPQQQLPPPVTRGTAESNAVESAALAPRAQTGAIAKAGPFSHGRRYFGYFTTTEVLIMIVGTLVAAVIIFMILEYV
jgi:hypothetical protein